MKPKILIPIFFVFLLTSCATQQSLYDWGVYDEVVYSYLKKSDEDSEKNLLKEYEKLIAKPKGSRKVPPPGVCADLGYLFIKQGNPQKGKELLEKEIAYYPESSVFIERVIKRIDKQ